MSDSEYHKRMGSMSIYNAVKSPSNYVLQLYQTVKRQKCVFTDTMQKSNLKVVNAKNNVQFDIWQCKTWALTCIMHFYRFTYLSCIFTEIGWSKKFIISKYFHRLCAS